MGKKFDYTRFARRFATRFPFLTFILSQVSFWLIAYVLLAILAHLLLLTAGPSLRASISLKANIVLAIFVGFFNGIAAGLVGLFFEKRFFYNKSLGIIIFGKAIINLVIFIILLSVVRSVLYPFLMEQMSLKEDPATAQQSWDAFFYFLLIFNIAAGLLINFINQVNRKYGPGVLLPLLLGKYRKPREEQRIFLFMDLHSSTSLAEALGHLKYSAFIRDSFMDINSVIPDCNAQVYQYVGDEVVVTWTLEEGLKDLACVRFYFACEARFASRSKHYLSKYGQVPKFKAGLHMGIVTAVEVGDIKRDIAYHGDTLNTAARIQGVCNEYNKRFLTSRYVLDHSGLQNFYETESIGTIRLKGKTQPVEIVSIESNPTPQ
ncbi:MAG: adenylate/guanylate cyclase domain-containing protein [Chitinophagaceae bacterium]|nr:adenylate/guanylate cyclase domain-containing protein [Chitinophagaceae bacterium]